MRGPGSGPACSGCRGRTGMSGRCGSGRWTRWTWWMPRTWRTACHRRWRTGCASGALARALVARPRLLLLDEPASGLSESELPEIGDLIEKLAADASVVVIEHRMDLMMSVCDTITVLDFGKV